MQNLFAQFALRFPTDRGTVLLQLADGAKLSYADALSGSARLANYLAQLGLRAGDRVTVQAPKNPMTLWLYLACLRSGLIFHPLNDAYHAACWTIRDSTGIRATTYACSFQVRHLWARRLLANSVSALAMRFWNAMASPRPA